MPPAIAVPFTDLSAMAQEVWPDIAQTYTEALLAAHYVGGPAVARFTPDPSFYASPAGAYVHHEGKTSRLHVSSIGSASEIRLVASKSHRSAELDKVKGALGIDNELNVGSVGVKLCLIALGVRDLYVNPAAKTKAWDTCAPEAILVAAGGRLTDLFGTPIDYVGALNHPRGLVASNGLVHDAVIAKIAPLFAALRS